MEWGETASRFSVGALLGVAIVGQQERGEVEVILLGRNVQRRVAIASLEAKYRKKRSGSLTS